MKSRIGAALVAATIFTGSALLPSAAMADDAAAAASQAASVPAARQQLQQELEARAQKDADAMASDAMRAASDFDLPFDVQRISPRALVLVSDL